MSQITNEIKLTLTTVKEEKLGRGGKKIKKSNVSREWCFRLFIKINIKEK